MFVKINGERHDLCRAVDHGDEILEADVVERRDRKAVLKFPGRMMCRYGRPRDIVTDRRRPMAPR